MDAKINFRIINIFLLTSFHFHVIHVTVRLPLFLYRDNPLSIPNKNNRSLLFTCNGTLLKFIRNIKRLGVNKTMNAYKRRSSTQDGYRTLPTHKFLNGESISAVKLNRFASAPFHLLRERRAACRASGTEGNSRYITHLIEAWNSTAATTG